MDSAFHKNCSKRRLINTSAWDFIFFFIWHFFIFITSCEYIRIKESWILLIKFENAANKQTNVGSKLKALFLTFLLQIVHQVICFSYILEMTSSGQKGEMHLCIWWISVLLFCIGWSQVNYCWQRLLWSIGNSPNDIRSKPALFQLLSKFSLLTASD